MLLRYLQEDGYNDKFCFVHFTVKSSGRVLA